MKTEKILGVEVDKLTYEDIISDIPLYIDSRKKMIVASINPQIVLGCNDNLTVRDFIENATHRIADGIGIVLVSKLTKGNIEDRIAGFELMQQFLEYANINNRAVFFYGAEKEVLSDMKKNINREYPNLILAGMIDGYTDLSEKEIIVKINEKEPDFLFVGLGFPKQEEWLERNIKKINCSVFQDVGGSFDVLSGKVKRAPNFFIKLNLEWLYRSLSSPRRMKRIFQLPIFFVKSILWAILNRKK